MQMNTLRVWQAVAQLVESMPCMREEQDSIPNSTQRLEGFHSGCVSKRIIEVQNFWLHVEFKASLVT